MGLTRRVVALCLLASSVSLASPGAPREHVVQPGQTLAKIAKRYRVEIDDLCDANDLKRSEKLQPGTRLSIPSETDLADSSGPRGDATHRVNRSVSSTARRQDSDRRTEANRRVPGRASYSQYLARPARRGWVHVMGHHGDWQGQLLSKSGRLQPKAAAALSRLLAWPRTDFPMDRRLLMLLAQVSDAFGGRVVRVVSGYRTTSYVSESKHPLGRACDFHVLGVPNAAVRDFVRTFDNVGVGYYPNSTFIHLDVRDHDAYWVDYAGPGEPPRSSPHHPARSSDDPGISVAHAGAATKNPEIESINPEAEADMLDSRGESSLAETDNGSRTARSTPLSPATRKRELPSSRSVAEPEPTLPLQSTPGATSPTPVAD